MLVNVTQNFMRPYALPILAALMLKANDTNATVAANILMCIGELTVVAGEDALPYVPQLMQVIITQLSDPSLVKRDAALHTLGQLCSSTGYVIAPFVDHPQLLQLLGRILRTETTPIVQREVVKVFGIIGALDPYRRKVKTLRILNHFFNPFTQSKSDESGSSEVAMTVVNQVALNLPNVSTSDDYFQTVVMSALLTILKDPSLNNHHHTVIEAIMSIFKTQGLKCVAFLPQVFKEIPVFCRLLIHPSGDSRICCCYANLPCSPARIPFAAAGHPCWHHQAACPKLYHVGIWSSQRALGQHHTSAAPCVPHRGTL
jgi:FKBP12-rapamycin complex-associated protein